MTATKFKHTPEEARALLVAALRSGDYPQCSGALCRLDDAGTPVGYCCLGVACELFRIHERALDCTSERDGPKGYGGRVRNYAGQTDVLLDVVREWLGFASTHGLYMAGNRDLASLASDNDSGKDFTTIADLIESEPEGLLA